MQTEKNLKENHIKNLYNSQEMVIKEYDDYSLLASEAKHKATKGEGLKMLNPK